MGPTRKRLCKMEWRRLAEERDAPGPKRNTTGQHRLPGCVLDPRALLIGTALVLEPAMRNLKFTLGLLLSTAASLALAGELSEHLKVTGKIKAVSGLSFEVTDKRGSFLVTMPAA